MFTIVFGLSIIGTFRLAYVGFRQMTFPFTEQSKQIINSMTDRLVDMAQQNHRSWIAVVGAPGSGKSTFTSMLKSAFDKKMNKNSEASSLLIIPMDGYHLSSKELDSMPEPLLAWRRRGAPFTFDGERCVAELELAQNTGAGSFPGFDHAVGDPLENQYRLLPQHRIVIVEGNYLLLNHAPWNRLSNEVFDLKWFIDVPLLISNQRVYERHRLLGMSDDIARKRMLENYSVNALLVHEETNFNGVERISWQ